MVSSLKRIELRQNFDVFVRALPTLLSEYEGKYVLMRHGQFIDYFDTPRDAYLSGRSQFNDDIFSVQEITGATADFGWYSRAPSNTSERLN